MTAILIAYCVFTYLFVAVLAGYWDSKYERAYRVDFAACLVFAPIVAPCVVAIVFASLVIRFSAAVWEANERHRSD